MARKGKRTPPCFQIVLSATKLQAAMPLKSFNFRRRSNNVAVRHFLTSDRVPILTIQPRLRWKQKTIAFLLANWLLLIAVVNAIAQEDDPPFSTSDTNVGYIDSAIPATQFRIRYDSAYDNPIPDRAEFFYRAAMAPGGGLPPSAETRLDYQDISPYFEFAVTPSRSIFVEAPVRFLNPELNANTSGVGDAQVGAKQVLFTSFGEVLTIQFRTYIPTGNASKRLGTDHASLEPGFLYAKRLNALTAIEGELKVWIPIDATEAAAGGVFSGPILRYGLGIGHDLYQSAGCTYCNKCPPKRITAVAEFVGWSILDGLGTVPAPPTAPFGAALVDVAGDTIVNGKFGIRWTTPRKSIYVGYGRGLTGDVWYSDILRAEFVTRF